MLYSSTSRLAGLLLVLLSSAGARAQTLYNQGSTITVGAGATLSVNGGYQQTSGAVLKTDGTTQVTGDVQSAVGAILDLSTGELSATGHVVSVGTTQSAATGTLRLTGTTNQNLDLAGGTVGRLIVVKAAAGQDTVRVLSDVSVTNQVQLLDGMVRTRVASAVRLPNGATVSGEAPGQYVQGHLVVSRSAVSGAAPVNFGNGVIINPGGNALGTVSVDRAAGLKIVGVTYAASPVNPANKSSDRIWTITPQTQPAVGQPAQLTMQWITDDDNGMTDFSVAVASRRVGMGPWAVVSTPQNAAGRSLTVAATTFSSWTVSSLLAPLPVELLTFTATRAGDAALVRWTTASEKNSAYFDVEVSPNGQEYAYVGRVRAAGSSPTHRAYELRDPRLLAYGAKLVYYRLRQVDQDGGATLFGPATVQVGGEHLPLTAQAWPNPFGEGANVQVQVRTGRAAPVELTIFDATGRLVGRRIQAVEPGTTGVALPEAAALPIGFYILRVRQDAEQVSLRIVRQ